MDFVISDDLELHYVPISSVILWRENPKEHDMGEIIGSIKTHGFRDPSAFDTQLGGLVEGNGRAQALGIMKSQGEKVPRGIKVDENGEWCMPILFGVEAETRAQAIAYAIDHNNISLSGGGFSAYDKARLWDKEGYLAILSELDLEELPVSVDAEDLEMLSKGIEDFIDQSPKEESDEPTVEELIEKYGVKRGQVWVLTSENGTVHTFVCGNIERLRKYVAGQGDEWEWDSVFIGDIVDDVTTVVSNIRKGLDLDEFPRFLTFSLSLDLVKVVDALGGILYGVHADEGIFANFIEMAIESGYNIHIV